MLSHRRTFGGTKISSSVAYFNGSPWRKPFAWSEPAFIIAKDMFDLISTQEDELVVDIKYDEGENSYCYVGIDTRDWRFSITKVEGFVFLLIKGLFMDDGKYRMFHLHSELFDISICRMPTAFVKQFLRKAKALTKAEMIRLANELDEV